MSNILYMIVPCYNEEEVLPETAQRLREKYTYLISNRMVDAESKIVFVNDGSKDRTWELIEQLHASDSIFSGINLSRNKGHQNAVLAGLMVAKDYCDMAITMQTYKMISTRLTECWKNILREMMLYMVYEVHGRQIRFSNDLPPKVFINL